MAICPPQLPAIHERISNQGRPSVRRLCNLYQCGQSSGDYTDSRCSWCAYFTGKIILDSVFTRCEKSQLITGWRRDSPPFANYDMCVQYSERRGVVPTHGSISFLQASMNVYLTVGKCNIWHTGDKAPPKQLEEALKGLSKISDKSQIPTKGNLGCVWDFW